LVGAAVAERQSLANPFQLQAARRVLLVLAVIQVRVFVLVVADREGLEEVRHRHHRHPYLEEGRRQLAPMHV
jgi:hypothetical protein